MRWLGIDLGAERIKVAEVVEDGGALSLGRAWVREHGQNPAGTLLDILAEAGWDESDGCAATGRMAAMVRMPRIPLKAAVSEGMALVHPGISPFAVAIIGAHGFAVVEGRGGGDCLVRENSRCSQGTGNFLRQLVGRFGWTPAEADRLCDPVQDPSPLSGRCPVILKTDMTHLANRGERRERVLAGLYDAVCENVEALLPTVNPPAYLVLAGGVTRSERIRRRFRRTAERLGMSFVEPDPDGRDEALEAFGAAVHAMRHAVPRPRLEEVVVPAVRTPFERRPAPREALYRVKFLPANPCPAPDRDRAVVLGLDIGSTGSKAVAVDVEHRTPVWSSYRATLGDPVGAARGLVQAFQEQAGSRCRVLAIAVTGSGREIAGTLATTCYGADRVHVMNEIAAHAAGARHQDPEVDTIFEIGGQDAKYIRLDGGRVVDAAMNEACSAGTGSFIGEQGRALAGSPDIRQLGELALRARESLSLGQHCSVFMAEVIEQAVAAREPLEAIVAGIYDSVVQNYLHRVKGARSVGRRVFCQGMPFSAPALAAAVAARCDVDVVVPPSPGTIGALGIALLAIEEGVGLQGEPLDLTRFLKAEVVRRDDFRCSSTKGCGGPGNRCRIERLFVQVGGRQRRFVWGGGCSLYDGGVGTRRLPDGAPDPFRLREAALERCLVDRDDRPGARVVAMTDEISLKDLFPFFVTFVWELGFAVRVVRNGDGAVLKRGIGLANVPACAPVQMFHGIAAALRDSGADVVLLPVVRELPFQGEETHSVTCPMVQGVPGMVREALFRGRDGPRLLEPVVDMGPQNLASSEFRRSCQKIAEALGAADRWEAAWEAGRSAQRRFDQECLAAGREALEFARDHGLPAVVVLGRTYTIHNNLLNSNVPSLLRSQGALAIPVDCLPPEHGVPSFPDIYWAHSQRNLRAAHRIRDTEGLYGVFCSNYSCGPDSFTLAFFQYIMEHKPFAVIETDGHSGDAGTRTRIEAFLHCVASDRRLSPADRRSRPRNRFRVLLKNRQGLQETRQRDDRLLIPPMGEAAWATAAVLRSEGFRSEVLPVPDREALERGRRHTSGKECLPMTITLGSLLQRLEAEEDPEETFAFLMPTAHGPCRFGVYNVLHRIVLERTGWKDRVRIVSPSDDDYFAGLPPDFQLRVWTGMVAADVLLAGLHDVRPDERSPGAAWQVFREYRAELHRVLEMRSSGTGGLLHALAEAVDGCFGVRDVVRRAARGFASALGVRSERPVIGLVGEIYVRLDPFANDRVVERLEAAGARVHLAPFGEWMEYTTWTRRKALREGRPNPGDRFLEVESTAALQGHMADVLWGEMGRALGWPARIDIEDVVRCGSAYVPADLLGEAILTVGGPLREYLAGRIDGVVSVGPLECMPNKIAESHLLRARVDHGLPSLVLNLNGEPVDDRVLEDFVFEVREARRVRARHPFPEGRDPVQAVGFGRQALRWTLSGTTRVASTLDLLRAWIRRENGERDRVPDPVWGDPGVLTFVPGEDREDPIRSERDGPCERRTAASRSSTVR